jgi:hypothetical protein
VIIMMNWEGRGRLCLMLKVRDHFQKPPSMWTLWPSQQRALWWSNISWRVLFSFVPSTICAYTSFV